MKMFIILSLVLCQMAVAETFTMKGYALRISSDELTARSTAIDAAKKEAQVFANHACWSRQAKGVLCGEFNVEVISQDLVKEFEAQATAEGQFQCAQRGQLCRRMED
jgi:hypothetical protein